MNARIAKINTNFESSHNDEDEENHGNEEEDGEGSGNDEEASNK